MRKPTQSQINTENELYMKFGKMTYPFKDYDGLS